MKHFPCFSTAPNGSDALIRQLIKVLWPLGPVIPGAVVVHA
jgi:hypothetical protein